MLQSPLDNCKQGKLAGESPGGGWKPQEIDGEDGENPSLCRNRIVPPR